MTLTKADVEKIDIFAMCIWTKMLQIC